MSETLNKVKKVQPLVRAKKAFLDQQSAALALIRQEKIEIVRMMKENQSRYMTGVDQLNVVRSSMERHNLLTLESGLDILKSKWYQLYKEVQNVEMKEKAQLANVVSAQTDLLKMEKLEDKYRRDHLTERAKSEQNSQDERSLAQFIRRDP